MGIPITRGSIPSLLLPHLHAIAWNIDTYPDLFKDIFTCFDGKHAVEYELLMGDMGPAQEKAEGAPFYQGSMQELWKASYVQRTYGISFTITQEALDDNLYPDQFPLTASMFKQSMSSARNISAMDIINGGFDFSYANGDSQPLFSLNHPTSKGTLANTFPDRIDLNEASLEDSITIIKLWESWGGNIQDINPFRLVVHPKLQYQASRLLNGRERTGTANREISALVHDEYIPGGFTVNPYIHNPGFWGVLTDIEHGFKFFTKRKPTVNYNMDNDTNNFTARIFERNSKGFTDWRCMFAAIGV
jgi:hypothetical protein